MTSRVLGGLKNVLNMSICVTSFEYNDLKLYVMI